MEKQIFTIGYTIPTFDENRVDFYSQWSLMDADILLISADSLEPRGGWVDFTASDGGCYDIAATKTYKQKMSHLKKEIEDYLNAGKNVFIFLTKKEEYQLANSVSLEKKGHRMYQTEAYSNYNFLPINIGTLTSAYGRHIEFSGAPIFSYFYEKFKTYLEYQLYIESLPGAAQIIFTGKDKTKVLGAVYKVKNGYLVVLPFVKYDEEEFSEYYEKESKSYWTGEAQKFGKALVKMFVEMDRALHKNENRTPPPDWTNTADFQLVLEQGLKKEVEEKSKKSKN